jgi:aryl-alcohol dehydrogenase-like predicted oxidoreductase
MKREGKLRAVGLSNHDAAQLEAAERLGHVDTLQPPFSAIRREAAESILPWCVAHNTGVIVYSVLQSGLLSGSFNLSALPADDWRARGPDYNVGAGAEFAGEPLRRNLALAEALKPIAARHEVGVAAVATAWTLAWPGVTAAIVGVRNSSQMDGCLAAAALELSPADMQEIADAIARTGAGGGPALPPR